ncbi:MAG: YfhO family protein, partial [Oscillospiraceae bacterium]|nr:YfhO family protein [Oscillospiraceae bacterium]
LYSSMLYLLAYSWNIMWLDCVMILPFIIMSLERLVRAGKYLPYVLSLSYALYANYYIAFMLCVFLVLYFIYMWVRRQSTADQNLCDLGRFTIGSVLGGGLAMSLLIPVYISLANTSAAGDTLPDIKSNFEMFALLGRHLYETTPTIRSGNLPNIYCGMLSVMLLPIFSTMKTIQLRRRLAYLGLLGVIAISFVINQFDLLWHGLHAPNDLPYRYSFLYSFVLLLICYETLINIRRINYKQIAASFVGILSLIMLTEQFGKDTYGFNSIYISLLLLIVYALLIGLISGRKISTRPAYILLLLIVTVESVFNAGASFKTMQSNEYFTARADYVANDNTKAIKKAVARTEDISDQRANGAFYRMEFLPRRTTVDTALFDYRGMTVFASSSPQNLTKYMGFIGYAVNGVNSHLYKSFVPMNDSLLGIRYVILDSSLSDELSSDPYLEFIEKVSSNDYSYSIYENKQALPLGYMVDQSIHDWVPSKYDPITSQNALYAQLTGNNTELYEMASLEVDDLSDNVASVTGMSGFSISSQGGESTGSFTASVSESGQTYTFIDCRAAENIRISSSNGSWSVPPHEPYIINTGYMQTGDEISVSIDAKDNCTGNIYVGTLNRGVFENAIDTLRLSSLNVTSFDDRHISGTINPSENGVLLTSIPFDKGWAVTVDGENVQTFAAGDAMLAFSVDAGEHKVEIRFFTVGLIPGVITSLVSLVLLILLLIFINKKVDKSNPDDNEFTAFSRLLTYKPTGLISDNEGCAVAPVNTELSPDRELEELDQTQNEQEKRD